MSQITKMTIKLIKTLRTRSMTFAELKEFLKATPTQGKRMSEIMAVLKTLGIIQKMAHGRLEYNETSVWTQRISWACSCRKSRKWLFAWMTEVWQNNSKFINIAKTKVVNPEW